MIPAIRQALSAARRFAAKMPGKAAEGLRTVDMKAAAVAAVAKRFGRRAVALLTVRDALSQGKSFPDPLTPV